MVGIISRLCLGNKLGCLKNEEEIVTYTKKYAVGYETAGLDIPKVLLNFMRGQP